MIAVWRVVRGVLRAVAPSYGAIKPRRGAWCVKYLQLPSTGAQMCAPTTYDL
ncbi:hypothetical protein H6G17_13145 [Chroococcidiopsis sp. FACHB-1243]|uniref:hypothetical protein n=1 Tax=Chroococcidiopsis sp. [FACHB-1243] TaxID=2692781 RepID=UPI001785CE25|nr:hypothetical protein [Chroococcidiopsis sp. [FACHB-1243]]MBD2306454.1 hypothetical protein [Chroococcidiopsis sp. [FACHB-1243]]